MVAYECPHCKKLTIPLGKKYLAGKWANIHCAQCGGRSCAQPVLMAVLYFLYVWDVMLFGTVAFEKQSLFFVGVMVSGWLTLDWFNLYIPLVAMKPLADIKSGDNTENPDAAMPGKDKQGPDS